MTTTRHGSRGPQTFLTAAFVVLMACLLGPAEASAQWTAPDASGNIGNTNSGGVGVGTTAPTFKFEVRGGSSRNTVGVTGDGDSVGYAGIRIGAFTTTNIPNDRTAAFVLSMRKDTWYGGDGSGPSFIIETGTKGFGFAAPFVITPTNDILLNSGRGAGGPAGAVPSYGNVGIGTHAPTEKLHVPYRVRFGNILVGESRAAGVEPSGETIEAFGHLVLATSSGYDIKFGSTGAAPRMILNNAGNVGIGTVSPAFKLDVAGSVNASGLCLGGSCKTSWADVGGNQWATSGTNINSTNTGNVGVGVASPAAKLHVGGGGRIDGAAGRVYLGTGAVVGARGLEFVEESATTYSIRHHDPNVAWRNIALSPYGGRVGVGTVNPLGPLAVGDSSVVGSDGYVVIGKNSGSGHRHFRLGFDTNFNFVIGDYGNNNAAGTWTSPFAINWQAPSSSFYINTAGNVGIGTATPGARFDLGVGAASRGAYTDLLIGAGGNNPQLELYGATKSSAIAHDEPMGGLVFYTNGPAFGPSFFVGNNGNVGVGTTSPGHRLDVSGNVNSAGLCIAGDCKTAWSQVGGGAPSQWANGAGSSINYTAGSVGIGTANPAYRLHVTQGSVGIQNSGGDAVVVTASGTANESLTAGWSASGFGYIQGGVWGGTVKNVVLQGGGGNVGIGTINPAERLEVSGFGEVKTRVTGTTSAGIQFRETTDANTWSEWQQYFDRFRLNTHDGTTTRPDVISVLPNGKVGIGKATPTEALDVVGNIKATGSVSATYQDVAEWVPSTQKLAAGTVVILDAAKSNHVMASTSPYDTKVAGVISEMPGVILGVGGEGKLMVATTGRVKVKVDATRGAIKVGDLLVTSEVEGVAMKSVPVDLAGTQIHRPGTIIGKALEPLEKGTGEILVLLSLQ